MHVEPRNLMTSGLLAVVVLLLVACGPGSDDPDGGGGVGDGGATIDAEVLDTVDDDGDGFSEAQGDCNDSNIDVHPDADEVCDDNIDNNCNGATDTSEPDGDGDGYGPCNGDCDDDDQDISPASAELPDDLIDNNCDGIVDGDYDGDGYTVADGDCDDDDQSRYPGADENCFDGVDTDCNGFSDLAEPDMDGDLVGPCAGDCDDNDINVSPNLPEIPNDGIDNNCDFLIDQDIDADGWTVANGDCEDFNAQVNPSVFEVCDDNIDNNCDGNIDTDCLSPCELAAATRSSVGCVYYAVDTNPIHSFVAGDYAVAVSNVDASATANVVIEVFNGTWQPVATGTFSVGPLALQTRALPHRYIDGSNIYAGGAYRITSDLPVIAYQFNPLDGSSSFLSDASLLLPASSLDTYYIVPAWPYGPADSSNTSGWPAHIQIAASAATNVRVTSPIATLAGGVAALSPGVEATFSLQEGDYLQLTVAIFNQSFNGTYIESDQPIAVFTSNDCANVPASGSYCCCEHLEEQVIGLQTWGTTYVASRVPRRLAEPVVWQIMAQSDNTVVTLEADPAVTGVPATVMLDAREMVELQVGGTANDPGDFLITADAPILVTQYMVGAYFVQNGGSNGDPSMVQAVPVEQYLDQYVVLVPATWINDFLVLTRAQGATVQIDGNPVNSGWVQVGNSNFEVARVAVADGVHTVNSTEPVGVIVVGYDQYDSYAYPGGLNQQLINPIN